MVACNKGFAGTLSPRFLFRVSKVLRSSVVNVLYQHCVIGNDLLPPAVAEFILLTNPIIAPYLADGDASFIE